MAITLNRPARVVLGILVGAAFYLAKTYGHDYHFDRPLPFDRALISPFAETLSVLVGLVILYGVVWGLPKIKGSQDPSYARWNGAHLLILIAVGLLFGIGALIFSSLPDNFRQFLLSNARPLSAGLAAVAGIVWIADSLFGKMLKRDGKTPSRAELILSRLILAIGGGGAVAALILFNRATLKFEPERLADMHYWWIAAGALAVSVVVIQR